MTDHMENKTCSKGHINPPEAQYCSVCREPLMNSKGIFTLDLYPNIHFVPTSIKKIRFVKGGEVFSWIFLPIIVLVGGLLFDSFEDEIIDFFHDEVDSLIGIAISGTGLLLLLLYGAFRGIIHVGNMVEYKVNADYIEETTFELVRVAKHGKLGLYNQSKNKLLLPPQYDKIEKFDKNHVLIGQNRFIGLYSIPFRRIIIPVECDAINPEKKGVFDVTASGEIRHYDVLGNILH